jgi:hypothetical protein
MVDAGLDRIADPNPLIPGMIDLWESTFEGKQGVTLWGLRSCQEVQFCCTGRAPRYVRQPEQAVLNS